MRSIIIPNGFHNFNSYLGDDGVSVGFQGFLPPSALGDGASIGKSNHPFG